MTPIVERHERGRCKDREPAIGVQCCDVDDHLGPHMAALNDERVLIWPSQDCIEDARAAAEIEAMTDEEIDAECVAHGGAEHLATWKAGTMAYVRGAIESNRRLEEAKAALQEAEDKLANWKDVAEWWAGYPFFASLLEAGLKGGALTLEAGEQIESLFTRIADAVRPL